MMSISRSMPRRGWTLLTAILATVAVIAALLTVPWGKAGAADAKPTDFKPNTTLGSEYKKELKSREETGEDESYIAADYNWGVLVWAGAPVGEGTGTGPNKNNDAGWAWCLDPLVHTPLETKKAYRKATATKLKFDNQYHDAVINLARKMESAAARGDSKSAANYYVYLLAFLDLGSKNQTDVVTKKAVIGTIRDNEDQYQVSNRTGKRVKVFPKFSGSLKEFTELTGYRIEGEADGSSSGPWSGKPLTFVKDPSVKIEEQPADAFITVVNPDGREDKSLQTVMPVDQPGLPDENGGSGSNPSEKKNAIVSTNADFENGAHEVVAGAKIVDQVSYEGLVPGKEYTLDAQLISKEDGKTVLGETKGHTFKPEAADGTEAVTITVNDDVTEPVEAAVAFETLTSKVVNDKGEDTPDNDKPNEIGEHKDINDDDQTVTKKKNAIVSTNADFENGSKEVVAGAKIVDQVSYEGLVPGKEYTLDAQLISKEDGKTVLGETKGHTFKPEAADGTEAVTITVNDD
ncbi:VaFE repeat-containing surface-anchored protein, partial [Corynebacterium sp.]|uniref:VaFE repeat-containing surface-anchored protein n=1 Tax=Corynebacterium sp. TaxID=1720 RepID=UPI0027B92CD3